MTVIEKIVTDSIALAMISSSRSADDPVTLLASVSGMMYSTTCVIPTAAKASSPMIKTRTQSLRVYWRALRTSVFGADSKRLRRFSIPVR